MKELAVLFKDTYAALRNIGDWPTSKVKGAFMMALFAALGFGLKSCVDCDENTRDLVKAESVDSSYSFSLDVDNVYIPYGELASLDSRRYHIDRVHGFALLRPAGTGSRMETEHNSTFFTGLSPATIPFFGHLAQAMQKLALTDKPSAGDIATTRMLTGKRAMIQINGRSRIGAVPLSYNPLADPALSQAGEEMLLELLGGSDELSQLVAKHLEGDTTSLVRKILEEAVEQEILDRIPRAVAVEAGVTIKSFEKSFLQTSPPARVGGSGADLTGFGYFILRKSSPYPVVTPSG